PFSFLPKGELNYSLNAGVLDNPIIGSTERNGAAQANATLGVTNWLTAKLGVDYYDIESSDGLPNVTTSISSRILGSYILNLENVTNGYYRAFLNAVYPNSSSISIDYTDFYGSSRAFNASGESKQLVASVFHPFQFLSIPFNVRASSFLRYQGDNNNASYRFNAGTRLRSINFNIGYSDRIINGYNPFEVTGLSVFDFSTTYTISRNRNIPKAVRGTFVRGQLTFLPNQNALETIQVLVSRNVFTSGRFQFAYGRNFITDFNSLRVNFVIDFKTTRSTSTFNRTRNSYIFNHSFRGSVAYDSNYRNLLFTSRNQVGRSGAAVRLFVDSNGNNKYDEEDEAIPEGKMRLGRSGSSSTIKDGILYYTQLLPYHRYNMEMNKASVINPMLVPDVDQFSMITDPNSFKKIEIPFYMSGVMEGLVLRQLAEDNLRGIGGLKLILSSEENEYREELRTFSDGLFYDDELPPGEYELYVDQSQLDILNVYSEPEKINFTVKSIPEGDFVEGLEILLIPNEGEIDSASLAPAFTLADVTDDIKSSPEVLEYSQEIYRNVDEALRLIIKAQNAFYGKNLNQAFAYVSESLELFETAQAYALKGSFYYFEGNTEQAQRHWQMALRFNPDLFIPNMELLEERVNTSSSQD
ncbi:MAG: hypothetical protein MI700_04620, partial [Balneolales bacterium]|nr:hypothetical protein [Balneolales bacterium]